jgi:hypothetical protein
MAEFKTLRKKEKRYVFDYLENRGAKSPAAVIFARFPLPGENFAPRPRRSVFSGLDLKKISQKNAEELDRLSAAFAEHYSANMAMVDYEAFGRECFEGFENFVSDGKEIKTPEDFFLLPPDLWTEIVKDCYEYAMQKDEFTMGESNA